MLTSPPQIATLHKAIKVTVDGQRQPRRQYLVSQTEIGLVFQTLGKSDLGGLVWFSMSQVNDRGKRSRCRSNRPDAATQCQVGEENLNFDSWHRVPFSQKFTGFLCVSPDCRSFPSSLWATDSPFLSQVTSLSSSFTPNPRMHHLPAFSYTSQPTTYSSYLSSPPPPPPPPPTQAPPPPPSHCGTFQPSSFYYGQNQQLHSLGEERSVVTALTNSIEGACLSLRGEEPVWRPY